VCSSVRVAALAYSAESAWSFAMLVAGDPSARTSVLRRRGGKVGDLVVEFVGTDRVWLSRDGKVCQAGFSEPPAAPEGQGVPPTTAPPLSSGHTIAAPRIIAGIARRGDGEFEVDRSVIERVRQDPSQLMAFGQLAPERDASGTTLGVRLATLKPGTLPTALGLESGDRLDTINGFSVANPEQMLEAYARLSSADMVTLAIVRKGKPMSINYAIK
jgi:general secretion pathway protein C